MGLKKTLCAAALVLLFTTGGACLGQTLREYADRAGVLVGAAAEPRLLAEPEYAATLAREFNMLTAENVLKWGTVRPARERFNFEPGDRLVAFAEKNRMKVRGHCLAWSEYNPRWLEQGNFTPEQMSELLREHVTKVMRHYRGKVFAWDVVNEIFLADGSVEPSVWYDRPGIGLKGKGTAYVERAFRWARAADPGALLFYNDYDTEGLNPKSDAVYAMVKDFRARGVPIDGVGIQAHIVDLEAKDLATFEQNLARLAALGVQVHITELDVGLPAGAGRPDAASLKRQAEIYRRIADACLRQPKCTAFQTWGFTDKYTWIPEYTKGAKGSPLPFDQNYKQKPAYDALLAAFRERALARAGFPAPVGMSAEQDHQRMMKVLGVERLRPGVDGYNRAAANAVNYDESKGGPSAPLPDPLVLGNGRRVADAREWWERRRPEIAEEFDREVYGRAPLRTPAVRWEVLSTSRGKEGDVPVVVKKLLMAGNFLKYAGPLTAADLPVDSHELIALIAPRPLFVGAGTVEQGDGWVDAKGMFLATAAASPVYALLGKKGLGAGEFPPAGTALTDGELAFRRHAGGHFPGPNWPAFIDFASRHLEAAPARKGSSE